MYYFREQLRSSRLYPILVLDNILAHGLRHLILKILQALMIIFAAAIFFFALVPQWPALAHLAPLLRELMPGAVGLLAIGLGLWLFIFALELFFRYYSSNLSVNRQTDLVDLILGQLLYRARFQDPIAIIGDSALGQRIFARLGITRAVWQEFAKTQTLNAKALAMMPTVKVGSYLTFTEWFTALGKICPELIQFLLKQEVNEADLLGALAWVLDEEALIHEEERWWSRERLGMIPGIAKDWSYGGTYALEKFSRDLTRESRGTINYLPKSPELIKLETILGREREANALVIAGAGDEQMNLLLGLATLIRSGRVTPPLEHKHLILLDATVLGSVWHDRASFERELLKLFTEARAAGNVILAISDFATLINEAKKFGVSLSALLETYLRSRRLQVLALARPVEFNQLIEPDNTLLSFFEKVVVETANRSQLIQAAMTLARDLEHRRKVFFTYPGLMELIEAAATYWSEAPVLDKVYDLASEAAAFALVNGQKFVGRTQALAFISQKTGIPLGAATSAERERLLQMEILISKRVIGQTQAVEAVSKAIRRTRVGIHDPKRPLASFLFLGPTGVGKTETAKALGAVFFNEEKPLLRLDMSEYQATDAVNRLIGDFASGQGGVLANLLRDNPYGVLLLDEFEKASPAVLNLFLQIIDEGFFSDMSGRKVNARNILLVATSNAGAELIWELVKGGKDLTAARPQIVAHLISRGLFRPELLNRFDDVIIFQPLTIAELRAVAGLMLGRLATRPKAEQGLILNLNDELATVVATAGADPAFGARPLARFIQDEIEARIASGLLSGKLKSGLTSSFDSQLNLQFPK